MTPDSLRAMRAHLALRRASTDVGAAACSQTILLYNSQWGRWPNLAAADLPAGWTVTTDPRRAAEAAAVVFHVPTLGRLPLPPKPPGQLWVAHSLECEENYPRLRDPAFMGRFDLTMTYRRDSDVPILYTSYYASGDNLQRALHRPPPPKRAAALYLATRRPELAAHVLAAGGLFARRVAEQ